MTTAPIDLSSPEARDAARLATGLDLRTRARIDGAAGVERVDLWVLICGC